LRVRGDGKSASVIGIGNLDHGVIPCFDRGEQAPRFKILKFVFEDDRTVVCVNVFHTPIIQQFQNLSRQKMISYMDIDDIFIRVDLCYN